MVRVVWVLCLWLAACQQSEDEDEAATTSDSKTPETTTTGTINVKADDVNATVPRHLAVTSVTAGQSTEAIQAGQLGISTSLTAMESSGEDSGAGGHYDLIQKIKTVLDAASFEDCLAAVPQEFNLAQGGFGHAQCHGPNLDYTNHPDTDETGSIGAGDLGMFWDYAETDASSGEACAARVVNNLMTNAGGYANAAVGFQAMVACAARIGGEELPKPGETKEVASLSELNTTDRDFTISSAEIARKPDVTGSPVFVTTVSGSLTDVPRSLTKNFELSVLQRVEGENASSYSGTLQFVIREFEGANDAAISIAYRWSKEVLKYRYRQTQRTGGSGDHFSAADEEVDPSNGQAWTEVIVDTDSFGIGKLTYVWETFDILVFHAETKTDGSGVAFFGHTPRDTPRATDAYYKIKGLRCYPINPAPPGSQPYSDFVQRQTLKLNTSTGVWELDESNIRYAPTTTCAWNASNDASEAATFTVKRETGGPGSEVSESLTFPIEPNLYDLSSYTAAFVPPEGPGE